jgi:hypothetical protein
MTVGHLIAKCKMTPGHFPAGNQDKREPCAIGAKRHEETKIRLRIPITVIVHYLSVSLSHRQFARYK